MDKTENLHQQVSGAHSHIFASEILTRKKFG